MKTFLFLALIATLQAASASRGVRFTENCVTTSVCVVSRATLVTGQWMSRHGHADLLAELRERFAQLKQAAK